MLVPTALRHAQNGSRMIFTQHKRALYKEVRILFLHSADWDSEKRSEAHRLDFFERR